MKVTITEAAPHPEGLMLGLRMEHEKAGWIRFGVAVLVVSDLPRFAREAIVEALNRCAQPDWYSEDEYLSGIQWESQDQLE